MLLPQALLSFIDCFLGYLTTLFRLTILGSSHQNEANFEGGWFFEKYRNGIKIILLISLLTSPHFLPSSSSF
jgi:hypothetical protein